MSSDDTYVDEDGRVRRSDPDIQRVKEIIKEELKKIDDEES